MKKVTKVVKGKVQEPVVEPSSEEEEASWEGGEDEESEQSEESEGYGEEEDDEASGDGEEEDEDSEDEDDDEFEDQGSSSDEDERFAAQAFTESDSEEEPPPVEEGGPRHWSARSKEGPVAREHSLEAERASGALGAAEALHVDDLSSDDEAAGNTIGRVPLRWYENYDHIGYDLDGKPIAKGPAMTGIEKALAAKDDPNFKRTVYDALNDREHVLTDRELEIIRRLQGGAMPHAEHDAMPDYVPYYTADEHPMPLSEMDPMKRRFVPSKWEMMRVARIAKGLKDGTYVPLAERRAEKLQQRNPGKLGNNAHLLWGADSDDPTDEWSALSEQKGPMHIAAPKLPPPGHAESYRPPDEYLFTAEEEAAWRAADPSDRELDFVPKKHDSMRAVGAHAQLVRDRFERCLDLYLCPRSFKRKLAIDPESLVPKLPSPKDLKPFPTAACARFEVQGGHAAPVRGLAPSPDGQFLVSGDDKGLLLLWEVATGRCLRRWRLGHGKGEAVAPPDASAEAEGEASADEEESSEEGSTSEGEGASSGSGGKGEPITHVLWNPNKLHHLVAVACGSNVYLVATGTGGVEGSELTDALLHAAEHAPAGPPHGAKTEAEAGKTKGALASVTWAPAAAPAAGGVKAEGKAGAPLRSGHAVGVRVVIKQGHGAVGSLCWHRKGDYLATAVPSAPTGNVMVHQISRRVTQVVIRKQMKTVTALAFHPNQPVFFVATQQHVRVYHLLEQRLMKKLLSGCKHVSCMDVHPSGDHLVLGSYDRRVVWFDLDRGALPFKTLKYHTKAVRCVGFHKAYPLLATASDDKTVHIFHATVYSDLMRDPFIVPVKVLSGEHKAGKGSAAARALGVLGIAFHPTQPWVFSAGADHAIVLYQDL